MDQIVLSTTKAANHINFKKDLMKMGISKDIAASLAHIFMFKITKEQKTKVVNIILNY